MNEIINAITQIGFPAIMCLLCFSYIRDESSKNREQIEALESRHQQQIDLLDKSIDNNTIALTKLITAINGAGEE